MHVVTLAVEQATADLRSLASKWESLFSAQVQLTEAARHRADKAGAEVERLRAELARRTTLRPLWGKGREMARDEILRMAREAGLKFDPHWGICYNVGTATLECFAALVAAAEREACAKLAESLPMQQEIDVRDQCAAAIRERGEK